MSLTDATVTIALPDLQRLQESEKAAKLEVARLQKELEETQLRGGDSGEAEAYRDAFVSAMKVVHFAIGELHPLTVRGWPYQALLDVATHVDHRPGLSGFERETAGDIRIFGLECKRWEEARAEGREKELLEAENVARGPVTPPMSA